METIITMIILLVVIPVGWTILEKVGDEREQRRKEEYSRKIMDEKIKPQIAALELRKEVEKHKQVFEKHVQEELTKRQALEIQKRMDEELSEAQAKFGRNIVDFELSPNEKKRIREREKEKLEKEKSWEKEFEKIKKSPRYKELLEKKKDAALEAYIKRYGIDSLDAIMRPNTTQIDIHETIGKVLKNIKIEE